ncbi:ATP-binding protein [Corallococcus terminator]
MARALAWVAAAGTSLLGLASLASWVFAAHSPWPESSGLPMTAPRTGVALVLGGMALGLRLPTRPSPTRRLLSSLCAVGMCLIALVSLLQEVAGLPLALEAFLARTFGVLSATIRPSPLTPLCLLFLGIVLLIPGSSGKRQAWRDGLVMAAMLLALLGFNGLLFGPLLALDGEAFPPRRGMGLYTALAVLLLGAGLLCIRPERGLAGRITRDTLGGFLARRLVPVALLGPSLLGAALALLAMEGLLGREAKLPLFAILLSAGGVVLVLLSARALDTLEEGRRAAREEAEVQRGLLQAVLNHAPVGVLFSDPERGTLVTNPFAETMLGPLPESAKRGAYLSRLRHPDGRPLTLAELPSTLATQTGKVVGPVEVLVVRPDGVTTPVLITAAPVFGPQGEQRGVVITGHDQTPYRELERLREEYVSLISHDLRNPLQGITLRASMLLRELKERQLSREEALTDAILRNVAWMSSMIEELLEGSRLESRGIELRREPTDVARFLEDVLERDVPPDLRERFRLEVATPLPLTWVDARRLERVLSNLLGNAAKYSPPDKPVLVRASLREGRVVVSVRDEGPGLAREDTEHVFDKYYRTRQGSASDTQGLGLGLYICRLIIEAHGGHIWVESEPGRGATFCFSVPTAPPSPEPLRRPEGPGSKGLA